MSRLGHTIGKAGVWVPVAKGFLRAQKVSWPRKRNQVVTVLGYAYLSSICFTVIFSPVIVLSLLLLLLFN